MANSIKLKTTGYHMIRTHDVRSLSKCVIGVVASLSFDRIHHIFANSHLKQELSLFYRVKLNKNLDVMRDSVSSDFQTPRRELKIRRVAEYF